MQFRLRLCSEPAARSLRRSVPGGRKRRDTVLIVEGGFIVKRYEPQADYSAAIEETFKKLQQGNVKDYRATLPDYPDMNHIEVQMLDFVALLFPAIFAKLDAYSSKNAAYLDSAIAAFDREIQFYLAYLAQVTALKHAGLSFCYPAVSDASKDVHNHKGYDLAVAQKLVAERTAGHTGAQDPRRPRPRDRIFRRGPRDSLSQKAGTG
jgi:hypothetical protein